jgi:uncharacterized membrane protein YgcG
MRRWPLAVLLLAVAFLVCPALTQERIVDLHANLTVQRDDSLLVHEVIQVYSEAVEIRHGIFRDFPTRYTDRAGQPYTVNFQLLKVLRDGKAEPYKLEDLNNGIRIRMGSALTLLDPGPYTYELTYVVNRELGFFPDHDELYWNVTGVGWRFPIDHASATVTLPSPVRSADVRMTGYTGYQASRDRNLSFEQIDGTTFHFETTKRLKAGQGLSIVLGFPKGVINEPSSADRVRWWMQDNTSIVAGLIGLVLVGLYYFAAWMAVGRGPKSGPIVISYEPPAGLSPAAVRFLHRMGYDDRVFVSAVVDLAVKGYLRIEQTGSLYSLKKLKNADGRLPPEELNLMRLLFEKSAEVPVAATDAVTFSTARKTLNDDLTLEENKRFFNKNGVWAVPGILMTIGILIVIVTGLRGPKVAAATFLIVWLSFWTVACVFLVRSAFNARKAGKRFIPAILVTLPFLLGEILVGGFLVFMVSISIVVVLIALAVVNGIGIHELRALTFEGRRLSDQIEGFKQFLTAVDSDRLQRLNPPEKTPQLFEKCFPYALALGVEQAWANQFTAVLAQAAVATGGTADVYAPVWINGSNWDSLNVSQFAGGFGSDFSAAISAAASPPGSSSGFDGGGGGGGGSGGGGGGGGGGGW